MNEHLESLTDKQASILVQFRQNVCDLLKHHHSDNFLLRWLRATKFDVKQSEALLRTHLKWREENNIDSLFTEYQPPEVMTKYCPGSFYGQDKEGSIIWIDPVGDIDIHGLLMSAKREGFVKYMIWNMEKSCQLFEVYSKEQDRRVDQVIMIYDLENLGLRHLWKPGIQAFSEVVQIFEEHYSDTIKTVYILNAPKIFSVIFNVLKRFLREETVGKIKFLGANYKEVLLQQIDSDQLPAHWGGTCVDPDGNPRCPSKICPGGMVPKYYYLHNIAVDLSGFSEVIIPRGSSFQLDFVINDVGSALRWQFKTEGFDIRFGIFRRTKDVRQKLRDMEPIVNSKRVKCQLFLEEGSVHCTQIGTYILRFDNAYSLVRSKKLYYLIEVLRPDEQVIPLLDNQEIGD
nr:SEC14-like protein 2 [Biomphalaria glabrata]